MRAIPGAEVHLQHKPLIRSDGTAELDPDALIRLVGRSLTEGALPIGLAHGVRLTRDVAAGTIVRMSDVALDQGSVALKLRREMAGKTGITSAT